MTNRQQRRANERQQTKAPARIPVISTAPVTGGPNVQAPILPGGTVYVSFSAEINTTTTESLIATMAQLASQKVAKVYLMISTGGGQVREGMNLYNVLRGMPFELTTHNVGNVDSIGNVIFLAGEKRYAAPHTTFMFHGVGFNAPAGMRFEEKFLIERLDGIVNDSKRIGAVMADRTKLAAAEIEQFFREGQTKDTAYAISHGIIDEVREVHIPEGARIVTLTFQRQNG